MRDGDHVVDVSLRWKEFRYRLEWLALVAAKKVIPRLSRTGCVYLANTIGTLAALLDREGRRVALSNLKVVFGDQFSHFERLKIIRSSYRIYARTVIDLFWSPCLTAENFRDWIEVVNLDAIMREIGPNRSCIFATFHYGNFEWSAKAVRYSGFPVLIVAQEFKNPLLDPIFAGLRELAGNEVTKSEGAIIKLFKGLRRGRHITLLTDLTLRPAQPSVIVNCFGLKTCVTFAHAWLHRRTDAPILPAYIEPLSSGRWRLTIEPKLIIPPAATETEIAQMCWDRFEAMVRRNPAPWLWMYKHWRYRPGSADRPYPFYAHEAPDFDALLAKTNADHSGVSRE